MQENKKISAYKQSLRNRILEIAMRAFRQNGIRAVKMDDIAAELSISKRTLYEIFENKEVLLFEGLVSYHQHEAEQMNRIVQKSQNVMEIILKIYQYKVEQFQMTTPAFYSDLLKYPQVLRYFNQDKKRSQVESQKFFERGVREGYFREMINVELAGRMFDALGRYIMVQKLYQKYPMEEIFRNFVFISLRGLCTPLGEEALDRFL